MHRQLGGSTKGLSTERLCTGKEDWCTFFSPIAGLPSGGDWKREVTSTQQTTLRINKPVDTRFTRNYMGAWRTWRRPPTSSLLLDWSRRRRIRRNSLKRFKKSHTKIRFFTIRVWSYKVESQVLCYFIIFSVSRNFYSSLHIVIFLDF